MGGPATRDPVTCRESGPAAPPPLSPTRARPGVRRRHPAPVPGDGMGGHSISHIGGLTDVATPGSRIAGGRPARPPRAPGRARCGAGKRRSRFLAASSVDAFQRSRVTTGVLSRVTDGVPSQLLDAAAATAHEGSTVSRPQPRGPRRADFARWGGSARGGRAGLPLAIRSVAANQVQRLLAHVSPDTAAGSRRRTGVPATRDPVTCRESGVRTSADCNPTGPPVSLYNRTRCPSPSPTSSPTRRGTRPATCCSTASSSTPPAGASPSTRRRKRRSSSCSTARTSS